MKLYLFSPNNQTEMDTIRALGFTGAYNDMQASYLRSLGYTGALPNMIQRFYTAAPVESATLVTQLLDTLITQSGDTLVTQGT